MDIKDLKNRIKEDENTKTILIELGMKFIEDRGDYYSACMPDGDNKNSTIIYKDSLFVEAYTRDIEDSNGTTDIISLVSFINKSFFSTSIKWICDICGYDYYGTKDKIPNGLKWLREIRKMTHGNISDEEDDKIRPLDDYVLSYYKSFGNVQFEEDGICLKTQREFEIGMDLNTHRITIPIRDEIGTLVGIKGRHFDYGGLTSDMKYMYLYKCPKSRILYGLYKTYGYIKRKRLVYVFESEKAVMQMWGMGIKNCVAIGSHKISKRQSELLIKLGVDIVFCYDKEIGVQKIFADGKETENLLISSNNTLLIDKPFWDKQTKYLLQNNEYGIMYDKNNIMKPKSSPSDLCNDFEELKKNITWRNPKKER